MYDLQPWDSVAGRGAEREPESAAAVANRASGESSAWFVGETYCASLSTAAYANRLNRERAERDATRRAEWERSQFAPIDESDARVIAGERGFALTAAVAMDLLRDAGALGAPRAMRRAA